MPCENETDEEGKTFCTVLCLGAAAIKSHAFARYYFDLHADCRAPHDSTQRKSHGNLHSSRKSHGALPSIRKLLAHQISRKGPRICSAKNFCCTCQRSPRHSNCTSGQVAYRRYTFMVSQLREGPARLCILPRVLHRQS